MKVLKSFALVLVILTSTACSLLGGTGYWVSKSSINDWNQIGDANWRIENGAFVADGGKGHLVSKESYEDFQIKLEFWVDKPANSGVFLRITNPADVTDSTSYEVNIFDTRADQTYRTGGIVHFAAPKVSIDTAGQWNTYDITAKGSKIVAILNGETTVELDDDTYSSGPLSLQYAAGVVKFRNVEIRKL